MEKHTIYLDIYKNFRCLAGGCPRDCCSGWRIDIDEKSLERFRNLENESLRRDVLGHIVRKKGHTCFSMTPEGKCSMLDPDGLCRIQRNTSEEMLCITCRKFPRLIYYTKDGIFLSMSASCPVVARYLINQNCGFIETFDGRTFSQADFRHDSLWLEAQQSLRESRNLIKKAGKGFPGEYRTVIKLFSENYFMYRFTDLTLDRKADVTERCVYETERLLRGFLEKLGKDGELTQDSMVDVICGCYRKFAHGNLPESG